MQDKKKSCLISVWCLDKLYLEEAKPSSRKVNRGWLNASKIKLMMQFWTTSERRSLFEIYSKNYMWELEYQLKSA